MNILMMLSLATGRETTLLDALTTHRLAWIKRQNQKRVHPLPEDAEGAAAFANETLLEAGSQPNDSPSTTEGVKDSLLDLLDGDDSGEKTDELLAMFVGARKIRDAFDALEVTLGRALRIAGVPNHVLAKAMGMSERSASKRYKPRPGEGLSSRV